MIMYFSKYPDVTIGMERERIDCSHVMASGKRDNSQKTPGWVQGYTGISKAHALVMLDV